MRSTGTRRTSASAISIWVLLLGAVSADDLPHPSRPLVSPLPGIAEPARQTTLGAPLAGILARLHVTEGAQVRKGDVVAVLDDRVARAALKTAQAAANRKARVEKATTKLKLAKRYLERLLNAPGVASEHTLDQARAAYEEAQAELEMLREEQREAQAQLEYQKAQLEQYTIRAPFDGEIVQVDVTEGQAVSAGQPLIVLVNRDALEADLFVPAQRFCDLRPGTIVRLEAGTPVSRVVQGTVLSADPRINAATETFRCRVRIDNPQGAWPSGFVVRLLAPGRPNGDRTSPLARHPVKRIYTRK